MDPVGFAAGLEPVVGFAAGFDPVVGVGLVVAAGLDAPLPPEGGKALGEPPLAGGSKALGSLAGSLGLATSFWIALPAFLSEAALFLSPSYPIADLTLLFILLVTPFLNLDVKVFGFG